MTGPNQLLVLPPSHYCERARWALDCMGVPYDERPLAVGLHIPHVRLLARRSTLPVLKTENEIVQGSGAILEWVGMPGAAPRIEQRFESVIGVLVRQFIYSGTLHLPGSSIRDALLTDVPLREARLARLAWPVTRRLMAAGMSARPAILPTLDARITDELDWFESELGDRSHLIGGCFGRADLTAASLLAPIARPVECSLYRKVRLPDALEQAFARWNARPSLRWVNETYGRYRRARPPVDEPVPA